MFRLDMPSWLAATLLVFSVAGLTATFGLFPLIWGHPQVCEIGETLPTCSRNWIIAGGALIAVGATIYAAILARQSLQEQTAIGLRQARIMRISEEFSKVGNIQIVIRRIRIRASVSSIEIRESEPRHNFIRDRMLSVRANAVQSSRDVWAESGELAAIRIDGTAYADALRCAEAVVQTIEEDFIPAIIEFIRATNDFDSRQAEGETIGDDFSEIEAAIESYDSALERLAEVAGNEIISVQNVLERIDADIEGILAES